MEDGEDSDGSEVEEIEVLFMGLDTHASNSDSDVEGEVDLRAELVSALEELEKCRKKNRQSNLIIMEDSEYSDTSETEVLFMGIDTQASNSDSDVEGEVDLRVELVSALEELDKCRKKNRPSNLIISQLEAQLLDAKKVEEDLNLQLKRRIQEAEKLAEEVMLFKRNLDE